MAQILDRGSCEHCHHEFQYSLLHNGFNDSAFAYCDACGTVAVLNGWYKGIPSEAGLRIHGPIVQRTEPWLTPCTCGGTFTSSAVPRCPACNSELSPESARTWLEANAPGTARGWRWQNTWAGIYCIVIEHRIVRDNWRTGAA